MKPFCRILTSISLLLVVISALGQGQGVDRRQLRKKNKDIARYLVVSIERGALIVPVGWKEVFFHYQGLPTTGPFEASEIFGFARRYSMDTLHSLENLSEFRFGESAFSDFFRQFRPLSLERVFNSTPFDTIRVNPDGTTSRRVDLSISYRLYFADTSLQSALEFLERIPGVRNPHRDEHGFEFLDPQPDDPRFGDMWHLQSDFVFGIEAQKAWSLKTENTGVRVGIIEICSPDSGDLEDIDHQDLVDNIYDEDQDDEDNSHGIAVAGAACARTHNGRQQAGATWNSQIYYRAGETLTDRADYIINAVDDSAFVINLSWGVSSHSDELLGAIQYAIEESTLVVASAGQNRPLPPYPAVYPEVLAVSAISRSGTFLPSGCTGDYIDVTAPGVDVWVLWSSPSHHTHTEATADGTSFSAPLVAGVAALMKSVNPQLGPLRARAIIEGTAVDMGSPNQFGHGRVKAYPAVKAAIRYRAVGSPLSSPPAPVAGQSISNNFMILKSHDSTSYTEISHARLAGNLSLTNTPLVLEKRVILRTGGYALDTTRVVREDNSEIVVETRVDAPVASAWNMTGLPVGLLNYHKDAVYPIPPRSSQEVFKYDGGYVPVDVLDNHRGYWVKFGSSPTISYVGTPYANPTWQVTAGFNIIGSGSVSIPVSNVQPSNWIIGGIIQKYENGGYVPVTVLQPGGGYWVKTSQSGTLYAQTEPEEPELLSLERMDSFTIADAAGAVQTLYVTSSGESIEMAPPPPPGSCHVRFEGGNLVEALSPARGLVPLAIRLRDASYPVTVRWNLREANGIIYWHRAGTRRDRLTSSGTVTIPRRDNDLVLFEGQATGVGKSSATQLPAVVRLHDAYPNPFNPSTEIRFDLPEPATVSLATYDLVGRQVAELADGTYEAGYHSLTWNAADMASGVYLARINIVNAQGGAVYTQTKKLLLMK